MNASSRDILVIGAGYGGLTAALRLSRLLRRQPGVRIRLVDRNPFHTLKTRLHEAAVGRGDVSIPIERFLTRENLTFHLGEVRGIDPEARTVRVGDEDLPWDHLVLALGAETNDYGIPGLAEHAIPLQSTRDAERIFDDLARACARASSEADPQRRKALLRFVVGGGGLSGVELAGELAEHLRARAAAFHLPAEDVEVLVVEGGPRLVPAMGEAFSRSVHDRLEARGVRIRTGVRITRVKADRILLHDGEEVPACTLLWTGGIKVSERLRASGLATGPLGRLLVDAHLRVQDHPDIWAIGDDALARNPDTGEPMPTAAQFALQQGRLVADNILRAAEGRPLLRYRPRVLGEVVSLGRHLAVGWMALPWLGRLRFAGFVASLLKMAIAEKHLVLLWRESRGPVTW